MACSQCERCAALLRDDSFVFRSMWGSEPWRRWPLPFAVEESCFARVRDDHARTQPVQTYFDETAQGVHCHTNW
eukprot:scaffold179184_cov32-Tisochrysis_lutea.AAC.3